MRLSEAMRKGLKIAPRQLNGELGGWGNTFNGAAAFGACALGTAYLGAGIAKITGKGTERDYEEDEGRHSDEITRALDGKIAERYDARMEEWERRWKRRGDFAPPEPQELKCPIRGCGEDQGNIGDAIVHLNDEHEKKRGYIIRYLERLEVRYGLAPKKSKKKKEKIVEAKYDHSFAAEIKAAAEKDKELVHA